MQLHPEGYTPETIQPNMFCPRPGTEIRMGRFGPYSTHVLLKEAMQVLGVNAHQLASQLGLKERTNIYMWLSGGTNMSLGYTFRLAKLLIAANAGYDWTCVASVDWERGIINFKKGFGPESAEATPKPKQRKQESDNGDPRGRYVALFDEGREGREANEIDQDH